MDALHNTVSTEIACEVIIHEDCIGGVRESFIDELNSILFLVKNDGGPPASRRNQVRDIGSENCRGIVHHNEHVPLEGSALCGNVRELFVVCCFAQSVELPVDLVEELAVRWEIVRRFHRRA